MLLGCFTNGSLLFSTPCMHASVDRETGQLEIPDYDSTTRLQQFRMKKDKREAARLKKEKKQAERLQKPADKEQKKAEKTKQKEEKKQQQKTNRANKKNKQPRRSKPQSSKQTRLMNLRTPSKITC